MRLGTLAAALLAMLWMPVSPLAQTSNVAMSISNVRLLIDSEAYAAEQAITVLIDGSGPASSVLYRSETSAITAAFVRRLDEEAAKKVPSNP